MFQPRLPTIVGIMVLVPRLAGRLWHIQTPGLPTSGRDTNYGSTVNGPSNTVKLTTSVLATCGPCRWPLGAKKHAPSE